MLIRVVLKLHHFAGFPDQDKFLENVFVIIYLLIYGTYYDYFLKEEGFKMPNPHLGKKSHSDTHELVSVSRIRMRHVADPQHSSECFPLFFVVSKLWDDNILLRFLTHWSNAMTRFIPS
jgi:hypothetical protein